MTKMNPIHITEDFSFPRNEEIVLKFWEENTIFKRSLEQTKDAPFYNFYDGPPFATGLPHHGHLLASTLKDIVPRYYTMKGRHVIRRFGWDCHGLPIEYEIDKQSQMSAQERVKQIGIKAYNDECRAIVQRYATQWRHTITRLGRWVDFDNDYKTMNAPFMESVWWVFKQLWEKDLIYQGTKVLPYSTALGTVLSNFEAGSNYQETQNPAITVLFKVKEEPYYMAAWTTTPWTLPSNLGLCVNPDIEYVKVNDIERDIIFILAKNRLAAYQKSHTLEVLGTLKGSELIGKSYEPLFSYFEKESINGAFKVFADDYVSADDGTGILHMAPAFGEEDHRIMKAAKIEMLPCPLDDAGYFTLEVPEYAGQHVKSADKQIIKDLKNKGYLYEQSVVVHSYPFCPRSDTPLIYRAVPSWYVKVEAIKEQMVQVNSNIHWVPDHIKEGRFGKWLQDAKDWAISRNRVWGTPLPIWINDETDDKICVGSIAELKKLTGVTVTDLHRDHVDPLEFKIAGTPGTYKRISAVLDCWFESGAMPYAQWHYPFENKTIFEKGFPAEFIAEGLDQTRGWFYTLVVLSTALFNKPAFTHVIVNGIIMAEDGKKMSKRLKNYTPPDILINEYGADALRLYLINSNLLKGEEQRFADSGVKEMVRRTLLPWLNAFKFLQTYAQVDKWHPDKHTEKSNDILDCWIYSRCQSLKTIINAYMADYKLYYIIPELLRFIDELTNWYIRLNRHRFWEEGLDHDKCAAYSTLYEAVYELTVCMAPFAPFLAETLYQGLMQLHENNAQMPLSVHLCAYPEENKARIDTTLEEAVDRMQQIILLGRQRRNQAKIKIKTPLKKLTVIHKNKYLLDQISKLEITLKKELNIKEISYETNEEAYIHFYAKPNSPVLGKRFGNRFPEIKKQIEALSQENLSVLETTGKLVWNGELFEETDILIFREAKENKEVLSNRYISISLDLTLNQDLKDEGLAREIVNNIQKSRKELGLHVSDRITIVYQATGDLQRALEKHTDLIAGETLALEIKPLLKKRENMMRYDIEEESMYVWIEKIF